MTRPEATNTLLTLTVTEAAAVDIEVARMGEGIVTIEAGGEEVGTAEGER